MDYGRGERECIKPTAGDADLWIKNGEELHYLAERAFWWKWKMQKHIARRKKRRYVAV